MSGTAVVRYILANTGAITTLVPAARIIAGDAPIATLRPLILVTQVSGNKFYRTVRANERPVLRSERVQVSVLVNGPLATVAGLGYPQVKALLKLVRDACSGQRGTINTFNVAAITDEGDGPDLFDSDLSLYSQSVDFFVNWIDP
jgi:hypothetical protein